MQYLRQLSSLIYSLAFAAYLYRIAAIYMYWIRQNIRFGSWAALLALTIQLVLSFGHIHPEDILAAPAVAAQQQAPSDAPYDNGSGSGRHHDLCATCVAFHLTSSSVVPVAETPAIPIAQAHTWDVDDSRFRIAFGVHLLFQARAPPST
jgi:hypothetical protein